MAKKVTSTVTPVLYILLRNDLESMNFGKGAAQASHASNAFMNDCNSLPAAKAWAKQTPQGFGTVLVLAVNERQMNAAVEVAQVVGLEAAVINDPTYPLRDGDTTHFMSLDTVAYVFAPDKDDVLVKTVLGNFPLYP